MLQYSRLNQLKGSRYPMRNDARRLDRTTVVLLLAVLATFIAGIMLGKSNSTGVAPRQLAESHRANGRFGRWTH